MGVTRARFRVQGHGESNPVATNATVEGMRRGIEKVEVRVDGGDWAEAKLGNDAGVDYWRQWYWEWDASAGRHTLEVRATDETGEVQTEKRQTPFPKGATGWHSVVVTIE